MQVWNCWPKHSCNDSLPYLFRIKRSDKSNFRNNRRKVTNLLSLIFSLSWSWRKFQIQSRLQLAYTLVNSWRFVAFFFSTYIGLFFFSLQNTPECNNCWHQALWMKTLGIKRKSLWDQAPNLNETNATWIKQQKKLVLQ